MHGIELHLLVGSILPDAAGGLGREIEKGADRSAGALACPELQHLSEQHQNGDGGRRLEIDSDRPVVTSECGREDPGLKRSDHAVGPRYSRAHSDERDMLRLRVTSDCQPRRKKGQPAQSTTGVARISCTQFEVCRGTR